MSIRRERHKHSLVNIVRVICLVSGQWPRSGTESCGSGERLAMVLIRALVSKCSRISCARGRRAGTTVEGRCFGREVYAVALRVVIVDLCGIVLSMSRWEFKTGRTLGDARVVTGRAERFVKVSVDFVLIATTLLTFDEEEHKGTDDTKTN